MDLPEAATNLELFKAALAQEAHQPEIFEISAVTTKGSGINERRTNLLDQTPAFDSLRHDEVESVNYDFEATTNEPDFTIDRDPDGTWVLSGASGTAL